jgi:hypothetical protein
LCFFLARLLQVKAHMDPDRHLERRTVTLTQVLSGHQQVPKAVRRLSPV